MTTIKLKNGSGAPTAGDLAQGEPALDLTNKRLYTEDSGGTVIEVGTNPTSVTTGTITGSGDMAIDTNTLFVDVSANAVGIGTTSPAYKAQISDSGNTVLSVTSGDSSSASLYLGDSVATRGRLTYDNSNDSLAVYTDNNERMRVDSSGEFTLGNPSGGSALQLDVSATGSDGVDIKGAYYTGSYGPMKFHTGGSERMRIDSSGNTTFKTSAGHLSVEALGGGSVKLNSNGSMGMNVASGFSYEIDVGGTEVVRIDSSGKVGIGESSPAAALHVKTSTNTPLLIESTIASGGYAEFQLGASGATIGYLGSAGAIVTSGTIADLAVRAQSNLTFATGGNAERMRIASNGNVGIGTDSPLEKLHVNSGTGNVPALFQSTDSLALITFKDNSTNTDVGIGASGNNQVFYAGSERMRLDSSGNLLVGKTSTNVAVDGCRFGTFGAILTRGDGSEPLRVNRTSSDGDVIKLDKDGTTVGSVGTASSRIYIGSSDVGLGFSGPSDAMFPVDASTGGQRDNAVDLGVDTARFDDIYATNGTIQTSDRNEKQDIEALSDTEQRVAVAAKGLLRKFRWIDSVEDKGDEARIHFGIIAQDLQDAFTAEGLDAGRYAMFINSTWTDEETGEERSRMGVRYSELLAFIIAAI